MAASASTFNAARRDNDWTNFVGGVASCANTACSNNTFDCLQNAGSSDILAGLLAAISEAPEQFAFPPTIDGSGGLYPDIVSKLLPRGLFARLPFIAGSNLDEGKYFISACTYTCALTRRQELVLSLSTLPQNRWLKTLSLRTLRHLSANRKSLLMLQTNLSSSILMYPLLARRIIQGMRHLVLAVCSNRLLQ
jgi:carboxylesterase type B